jgi:hypothetical protein
MTRLGMVVVEVGVVTVVDSGGVDIITKECGDRGDVVSAFCSYRNEKNTKC